MEKQEQKYLTLTKKEREQLGKRVLHRYHDLGERVYSNTAEELFEGTGIPTEIIREELARIKPELRISKPKKERSLESQIIREDLKKVGKTVVKAITYPTLGVNLAFPTLFRKSMNYAEDHRSDNYYTGDPAGIIPLGTIIGTIAGSFAAYTYLAFANPKLIFPLLFTQLFTNSVSQGYEWTRSVRKRAERRKIGNEEKEFPLEIPKELQLELPKEEKTILYH